MKNCSRCGMVDNNLIQYHDQPCCLPCIISAMQVKTNATPKIDATKIQTSECSGDVCLNCSA